MSKSVLAGHPANSTDRFYGQATLVVLVVAAILRIALVWRGGQFFFPDEHRYSEAREAAAQIASGNFRAGLAAPFEGGDHAGFKLLGLIPAFLERGMGESTRLPALFFALFSVGTVWLPGLIAGRLGASAATRLWATLAAAMSATLFYYSRHLLPYDTSMCCALLALYLMLAPQDGEKVWRLPLAGAVGGCGILIYYGYWPSIAIALVLGILFGARSLPDGLLRAALAGAGLICPALTAWAINQAWGNGQLIAKARQFSSTITSGGDYRGSIAPFEFLWRAEGLWFAFAGLALAFVIWRWATRLREKTASAAEKLTVVACALLWATFVVSGDLLHKFVVYGRLARQFTPFLALSLGLASASAWSGPWRRWALVGWIALGVNATWFLGRALTQQFPADFRQAWAPVIEQKQQALTSTDSYYRLVNVEHFIYEPEILETPPLETLAATRHPFEFVPYLYEGFSAADRAKRLVVDHRMRAVRMHVPPTARINGEPSGLVTLKLKFPSRRGGFADPLLSIGLPGAGCLFFVRYETDTQVRIGCDVVGAVTFQSEPQSIEPGRTYTLQCYSSALDPDAAVPSSIRQQIWINLEGRTLLARRFALASDGATQVYTGANVIGSGAADARFYGEIMNASRGNRPPPLTEVATANIYGAVKLVVSPPESRNNRPEPLVVAGEAGRAVLGYLVPQADGRVALGAEIWGVGTRQSAPLSLHGDGTDEIVYEFGSLFPVPGDPAWANIPPKQQIKRNETFRIWLNRVMVLDTQVKTPELLEINLTFGKNPIGGSFVGESYSGRIVRTTRLPIASTAP